ncbi:MAG: hypothetical protein ACXVYB_02140 [Arthrobacter sp.]
MNNTPRTLNRILLGIFGLKLAVIGLLLVLLATVPAVGTWWHTWSASGWRMASQLLQRTRFPGREDSWLWVVVTLLLALVVGLMVAWAAQQGKGRANLIVSEDEAGGYPGNVQISGAVAEQALRAALADRPDLAGASVTTYEIQGEPALKIRLQPRQGVAPHVLAADTSALVEALDAVVGKRTPVLIHVGVGARSRFSRAERVR